jgi:ribosomal protein S5
MLPPSALEVASLAGVSDVVSTVLGRTLELAAVASTTPKL